jgi:predicted phosphodiesterase
LRGVERPADREPIAILSDIHGNLRALDAVLAEIERRGVRRIVNLGDCLYGPFDPRPAADRLIALGLPTVSGNEDRVLLGEHPLSRTAALTRARLTPSHVAWIGSLPRTAVVAGMFLCHGTPTDDETYLLSSVSAGALTLRASSEIDALVGSISQRILLCGHDHTPRVVEAGGRLLVNPGSVGCPAYTHDVPEAHVVENGSAHARFALIFPAAHGVSVESIGVAYDAPAAAAEARANGFADWATWIAAGRAS